MRIGIGTILAFGTGRVLRGMLRDEEPSGSFVLFARTVGIRDTLFGLGCLLSTREPSRTGETRRWVQLWLANEVADVVAAIAMSRQLGAAGAASAAAAPLPLIAVDAWTLRHLTACFGQPAGE
jgi:hypothetical protein